jgi:hypothetical protein
VKVLSIRQPWAWAILEAGKRVENRSWNTKFRGEFLIHVSASCPLGEYLGAMEAMVGAGLARRPRTEDGCEALGNWPAVDEVALGVAGVTLPRIPLRADLVLGGIVGRARLVDVLYPAASGRPRATWHMADAFGFVLEDVVALPFQPLKGCLGFFDSENPNLRVTLPGAT